MYVLFKKSFKNKQTSGTNFTLRYTKLCASATKNTAAKLRFKAKSK